MLNNCGLNCTLTHKTTICSALRNNVRMKAGKTMSQEGTKGEKVKWNRMTEQKTKWCTEKSTCDSES